MSSLLVYRVGRPILPNNIHDTTQIVRMHKNHLQSKYPTSFHCTFIDVFLLCSGHKITFKLTWRFQRTTKKKKSCWCNVWTSLLNIYHFCSFRYFGCICVGCSCSRTVRLLINHTMKLKLYEEEKLAVPWYTEKVSAPESLVFRCFDSLCKLVINPHLPVLFFPLHGVFEVIASESCRI